MANGRFIISKDADGILSNLMVILEIERPLALKIALSKGLLLDSKYEKESEKSERGREIPDRVVLQGFDYTLFSHLIIEKEQRVITDEKELDEHIRYYIEQGLFQIKTELAELPAAENYLLNIVSSPQPTFDKANKEKEADAILSLLGL